MSQDDLVEISFETSFSNSTLECLFFPPSKVPLCLNDLLEEINTKRQKCKENKFFRKNNEYHLKEVQTNSKTKKNSKKLHSFISISNWQSEKKRIENGKFMQPFELLQCELSFQTFYCFFFAYILCVDNLMCNYKSLCFSFPKNCGILCKKICEKFIWKQNFPQNDFFLDLIGQLKYFLS